MRLRTCTLDADDCELRSRSRCDEESDLSLSLSPPLVERDGLPLTRSFGWGFSRPLFLTSAKVVLINLRFTVTFYLHFVEAGNDVRQARSRS